MMKKTSKNDYSHFATGCTVFDLLHFSRQYFVTIKPGQHFCFKLVHAPSFFTLVEKEMFPFADCCNQILPAPACHNLLQEGRMYSRYNYFFKIYGWLKQASFLPLQEFVFLLQRLILK